MDSNVTNGGIQTTGLLGNSTTLSWPDDQAWTQTWTYVSDSVRIGTLERQVAGLTGKIETLTKLLAARMGAPTAEISGDVVTVEGQVRVRGKKAVVRGVKTRGRK